MTARSIVARTLFTVLCSLLLCVFADGVLLHAQNAPAGNAHPEHRALSESGAGEANPFGAPAPTTLSMRAKHDFASRVDLEPLRTLAVGHNGRVKILGTLAGETVQSIMGRRNYMDFEVDPATYKATKLKYDPLFTFVDIAIDPGYYADKPLIHVSYLPLREAFLDELFAAGSDEYDWWKRLGRLKPVEIAKVGPSVEEKLSRTLDQPMQRGLGMVRQNLLLYRDSWQNLMMIAPTSPADEWHLFSEAARLDDPAAKAAAAALEQLGVAWRAGDADGANAAIGKLAAALPSINAGAGMYPGSRRTLEHLYNRANAFEWGFWLYGLSLLLLVLAFGTGRRWLAASGVTVFGLAFAMHSFGFVARCIIAERFAIQNQFESMTGLSLFAALAGAVIMLVKRQWLYGAAAAGVGFMVLITATQTGIPGVVVEREAAILNTSVLLKYHVTTVLVSYGLISLGFMIALFYLGTHYANRLRSAQRTPLAAAAETSHAEPADAVTSASAAALGLTVTDATSGAPHAASARVLHDLDKAHMIVLQLAFWSLAVGILLGAWWADHSWGRWWAFDPKELWALVTWIVYLVVIHLRFMGIKDRALVTAWMSVLGFFVMLWTYFGVNLLLPGLHAYA